MLVMILVINSSYAQPYPIPGDHVVCQGSTEPYGVEFTSGNTYAWSIIPNPDGNGTLTVDPVNPNLITILWTTSGTATLQLIETSSDGCEVTVTIGITINATPVLVINDPAAVCQPLTVDLTDPAVTAGSTLNGATLTYWEDLAATIPLANPNAVAVSGTYYIQAGTAAGCSDIQPVEVIINPSPVLVINDPAAVCQPLTVDLTDPAVTAGSTLNGATLSYWEDAAATIPLANPNAVAVSGTYYIQAETAEGCSDIQPVNVIVNATPVLVINDPAAVCQPLTVDLTDPAVTAGSTLNGATLTYWEDAAATIPLANPNAVAVSGTYYIQAETTEGCSDIQPVNVIINATPILVINDPAAVCQPLTVDLTDPAVTAGSTLNGATLTYWEDIAGTIPLANPNAVAVSGTYYIQAGTAAGCSDIQPVEVIINPSPVLVINDPAAVCQPLTVDLTGPAVTAGSTLNGATLTYWEDAAATIPLANPNAVAVSGTYYIQAETAEGCSDIQPVNVIVNPTPTPTIVGVDIVCEGDTEAYEVTLNAGNSYFWTVVGGTIDSGQNTNQIFVTWDTPGPGSVQVAETAGTCTGTDLLNVIVNPRPATTTIFHN